MAYQYSKTLETNHAKAVGIALPISRKESVNVCSKLRGMNVDAAKKLLADVIALKKAIPYTRYNMDVGHKAGMAAGRFPVSACFEILKLVKSAEANAQFKGLSTAQLKIKHISAQKGPTSYHFGRQRTRAKRTHIEIVLEEGKK